MLLAGACSNTGTWADVVSAGKGDLDLALLETSANQWVQTFGDEGAFAAVVLALDRGFDLNQQLLAQPSRLTADGHLDGVTPLHPPFGITNLVAQSSEASLGLRTPAASPWRQSAAKRLARQPSEPTEAALLGFDMTLGELSRMVLWQRFLDEVLMVDPNSPPITAQRPVWSDATPGGVLQVMVITALAARGYDIGQIVQALVLGDVDTYPPGSQCLVIPGERPSNVDSMGGICPEPIPPDQASGAESDDRPDAPAEAPELDHGPVEDLPTDQATGDPSTGWGPGFDPGVRSFDQPPPGCDEADYCGPGASLESTLVATGSEVTGSFAVAVFDPFDDGSQICAVMAGSVGPGQVTSGGWDVDGKTYVFDAEIVVTAEIIDGSCPRSAVSGATRTATIEVYMYPDGSGEVFIKANLLTALFVDYG